MIGFLIQRVLQAIMVVIAMSIIVFLGVYAIGNPIDVMIDPIMNVWDCAPLLPLITEAGGRFTDWKGDATIRGGDAIATNGRLHSAVLSALR